MSPTRRIGLFICNSLFRLALLVTMSLAVFNLSFRTPTLLKASLVETKAYERFVPAVIEDNKQRGSSLPLDDPEIRAIAARAFSPELMQKNAEQFIDATYAWLQGETYQPRFRIDFSSAKQQFANEVGAYEIRRLKALPVCATYKPSVTFDVYNATCRPLGLQLDGREQDIAAEIMSSQGFMPKSIFTADDLPRNDKGETISQRLALAPLYFRLANSLMWIFGGLTILLAAGMVYLRPSRRKGWRSLGIAILSDGALLAISALVFRRFVPGVSRSLQSQFSGGEVGRILSDLVQNISVTRETLFINISIQVAAVGLVMVVLLKIMQPRTPFVNLEKMSGLVSGMRMMNDDSKSVRAGDVPLQSSEYMDHEVREKHHKPHKLEEAQKEIA
jgi:hypothetical protein